jgi:DNA-binding transcriptional regulator YdaS (Cro superfamily)
MNTHNVDPILKAVEIIGSIRKLALKIGVSYQSVLDWKNSRRSPTPLNCLKIEKATEGKVKAEEIMPNYPWNELR